MRLILICLMSIAFTACARMASHKADAASDCATPYVDEHNETIDKLNQANDECTKSTPNNCAQIAASALRECDIFQSSFKAGQRCGAIERTSGRKVAITSASVHQSCDQLRAKTSIADTPKKTPVRFPLVRSTK